MSVHDRKILTASDIEACDRAIRTLERVLGNYKRHLADLREMEERGIKICRDPQESYVQLAIAVLAEIGKPTPITVLLDRIRQRRNDPTITRGSVETSLLRHLSTKGEKAEFAKAAPGTYVLRTQANYWTATTG